MVIKTNMSAVRTLNLLNANQSNLTKDLQKVSSGQRINSAGDDVSGYGISERMRNRIRGLEQCSRNVRTGYNMLSVAAQAVEQQVNILGKMREIALKASDDTYTQKDRDILAGEADQLFDQLEHIAQETNYNGINLLNRSTRDEITLTKTYEANSFADFDPLHPAQRNTAIGNIFPTGSSTERLAAAAWGSNYSEYLSGYSPTSSTTASTPPSVTLDFANALSGHTIDDFNLQGFSVLCSQCTQFVSIVFSTERDLGTGERQDPVTTDPDLLKCRQYIIGINGAETADDLANAVYDGITAANREYGDTGSDVNVIGEHDVTISRSGNAVSITQYEYAHPYFVMPVFYEGTKGVNYTTTGTTTQVIAQGLHPWEDCYIQSDTKASQATKIRLWNTTLDAMFPPKNSDFLLDPEEYPTVFNEADYPDPDEFPDHYTGYTGTKLQKKQQLWRDTVYALTKKGAQQSGDCMRTRQGAQDFLADLDQALNYCLNVSTSFGSQMMRMRISEDNITMNHENTTASESTIRDADMAKAMTSYTKNNILLQAAQSMLSQANQNSSTVMALLQ